MSKVNNGVDFVARALGGVASAADYTGTATGTAATTMTNSGASWSASSGGPPETGGLVGFTVVIGGVYGVIVKNTSTVLTVDFWHDPADPGGDAAATPSTGTYVIVPGAYPAAWLGLSVADRAIAAADAFLTDDGTTISEIWNSGGGLNRALAACGHTIGQATFTYTKTFTSTAQDPASSTIHRVGVFQHGLKAAPTTTTTGIMFHESDLSADAIITNNATDQLTVTVTDTIS